MFRLLLSMLFVHVVLLVGMFDVYFKSPIVPGLPPVPCTFKTPAKRLVLFIGDGLRADHFFDTCNAPFLRGKVESGEAISGVSHTHLPTESRPGTVAIAAGVYEDPSAVFKGWQDNPVPVDSFFNRCKFSFAWGSPDIVHLFSRNANNINASSYSDEDQSFDPQVSLSLNQWVFDNFVKFLEDCKKKEECLHLIHGEKISFFFHFIGIDMSGHKSKPHSTAYNQVIFQADGLIRNLTKIIDDLYQDDKTAYVFTSDHGMTDWGSHGAGSPQETRTPLVVWGSGVRKLALKKAPDAPSSDNQCQWAVSPDDSHDVEQADIATLMSTLLGVELPTNSRGAVPIPYLNFDRATIVSALLLNLRQQYVLFNHLASLTKRQSSPLFFYPFTLSTVPVERVDTWSQEMVAEVTALDEAGFQRKISVITEQISEIKRGIEYYHTYFQNYLLFLLTMSFLGLIALIFGYLCFRSSSHFKGGSRRIIQFGKWRLSVEDLIFISISIVVSGIHLVQALPLMFYAYSIMPVILWWKAVDYLTRPSVLSEISHTSLWAAIGYLVLLLIGVELLYLSFYYRWVLSLIMASLSISPWLRKKDSQLYIIPVLSWTVSSIVLAIFPLLPAVGAPKLPYIVVFSGILYISVAFSLMFLGVKTEISTPITKFQIFLMMAVVFVVSYVDFFLPENGRKDIVIYISWTILVLSSVSVILSSKTSVARLFNLTLACGVPFTMLSSSFEALFLPTLSINMGSWIWMELDRTRKGSAGIILAPKARPGLLPINEVSTGALYLFFIIFSFFGIGNINSLNSFDIDWVRCFIDVFSPFTMTMLIVLKTGMPFFLVSCFMRLIISEKKADYVNILLILLLLCEVMGLMFLFRVTNTGSWLDIGTSISHYVIMEVSAFIVVLTFFAAGFMLYPQSQEAHRRRYAD